MFRGGGDAVKPPRFAGRRVAVAAGCGGGGECRANRLVFFVSLVLYVLRMTARTPLVRRGG